MPYDLFYDGHHWLTTSYKAAHEIRRERDNFDAYLNGTYVYQAFATALGNAFAKKGQQKPWMNAPFDIYKTRDRESNITEEAEVPKGEKAGIAFMQSFMESHNRKMANEAAEKADVPDESGETSEVTPIG